MSMSDEALLALPAAGRKRVAVLGLGAGSSARLVRALLPDAEILGVEFDPEIVRVARRHFALDDLRVEVVVADHEGIGVLHLERRMVKARRTRPNA